MNKAQRNLNDAEKDNNFIYHDRVPEIAALPSIGKAQPAKILQLQHPLSQNFKGKGISFFSVTVYFKNKYLYKI